MIRTVLQSLRKSGEAQPPAPPAAAPPAAAPAHHEWQWPNAGATGGEAVYCPEVFEPRDLQSAKVIALTFDGEKDTNERWVMETDFTVDHIASRLAINEKNRVIDFGCGAGRMSRALIERFGCSVVGIDISQGMREQARAYVASPRFTAVSPQEFDAMLQQGFYADFGIACWSLQHCLHPKVEIARIANGLVMEAPFMLLNSTMRLVPTDRGWHGDNQDLDALMRERFTELERLALPAEVASEHSINTSSLSWWQRRV